MELLLTNIFTTSFIKLKSTILFAHAYLGHQLQPDPDQSDLILERDQ